MPLGIYHDPEIWLSSRRATPHSIKDIGPSFDEIIAARDFGTLLISISRDGLFVFDFSKWQHHGSGTGGRSAIVRRAQQIELMNTFLLCFYCAVATRGLMLEFTRSGVPIMRAAHSNVLSISTGGQGSANLSGDLSRLAATRAKYARGEFLFVPQLIPERALDIAFELFSDLWRTQDAKSFTLADLLLGAHEAQFNLRFAESLALAWLITETLLNEIWRGYIERNRRRNERDFITTNKKNKRLDRLTGMDYTASVQMEMLSLLDEITYELYTDLNYTRVVRNNWIHELKHVTVEESEKSIQLAEQMFRDKYHFDTTLPTDRGVQLVGGGEYIDEAKPPDPPMRDVEFHKVGVHHESLQRELKGALGDHTPGFSYSSPALRLHLLADAPAEDEEIARAIIDAHDPAFLHIDDGHKTLPGEYKFDGPRLLPHVAGNGSDEAVVTIQLPNTNKSQVVLVCEEVEEAIDLSNGIGNYKITSSAPPGTILRAHVKDHPGDPLKIEVIES